MMNKLCILPLVVAMLTALAFGACSGVNNDYSEYRNLNATGWRYADTLKFVPIHTDSLCWGHFVVAMRHDETYQYKDCWLEVTSHDEAHRRGGVAVVRRDTVHFVLTDRFGNHTGHGIGASFQLADTLPQVLHATGNPVAIKHIMRTDTLQGVSQIGLFFVPSR